MWYNDRTGAIRAGRPVRPAVQGLYQKSTAWEVNAAYASLPSLRTWYNDRTGAIRADGRPALWGNRNEEEWKWTEII